MTTFTLQRKVITKHVNLKVLLIILTFRHLNCIPFHFARVGTGRTVLRLGIHFSSIIMLIEPKNSNSIAILFI